MASLSAHVLVERMPSTTTPVADPRSPTWTHRNEHHLHVTPPATRRDAAVVWTCREAVVLTHTSAARIRAATLAHFPPPTDARLHTPPRARHPTLCVATDATLSVLRHADIDCADACPHPSPLITRLYPLPAGGLLVELVARRTPLYRFLAHPLHPLRHLPLPDAHRLLHVSPDLPLLASVDPHATTLHLWAVRRELAPVPDVVAQGAPIPLSPAPHSHPHPHHHHRFSPADALQSPTPHLIPPPSPPLQEPAQDVRPRSPVLALSQLHCLPISTPPSSVRIFLAHDLRGLPVVCVVADASLTGFSLVMRDAHIEQLVPSFRIRDVASAVPVLTLRAAQRALDILVQSAAGAFSLYAGRSRLCSVELENLPAPASPITLVHPLGHTFSVRQEGISYVRRYSMQRSSFLCPLVNASLAALSYVLDAANSSHRLAYLYQQLIKVTSMQPTSSSRCETEFQLFERSILKMCMPAARSIMSDDDDPRPQTPMPSHSNAWEFLISHNYHLKHEHRPSLKPSPQLHPETEMLPGVGGGQPNAELLQHCQRAFHLLYENCKLDSHKHGLLRRMVPLLAKIAVQLNASSYLAHYKRDFPSRLAGFNTESPSPPNHARPVPSIISNIASRIQGVTPSAPYPALPECSELTDDEDPTVTALWRSHNPFELSRRVLSYYDILYNLKTRNHTPRQKSEALLKRMTQDGFRREDLESLPLGICLPLQDTLFHARLYPPPSASTKALALLNRQDMYDAEAGRHGLSAKAEPLIHETTALLRLYSFAGRADSTDWSDNFIGNTGSKTWDQQSTDDDERGKEHSPHRRRFCEDRRIQEVDRILRSTEETVISPVVKPAENAADFDLASELKQKLDVVIRKRLAAPVGRGAFTLRTFVPSDPTKPLFIPKLCVTGKLLGQKGARVTLSGSDPEALQWGEFHNGVASGLRIIASSAYDQHELGHILSRTWIVNHRPEDKAGSPSHAGMLLACGLGGYLPALRKTDYYQYLLSRHELTAIGLMLGLSVCNIGSMDEKITKMLCLHIRAFNAAGFSVPDFHVSVSTQAAAVLGLGMLHRSSLELGVVDGLMQELAYRPKPGDAIDNREALALAAGLSIGLVCLGNGSAIDGAENRISEKLLSLANGRLTKGGAFTDLQSSCSIDRADFAGLSAPPHLAESETSRIEEGGMINTDVAPPGALLALALIYMKTNDKRLAERILLPDSLYSLDRLKPLHVFLVVLTRALVMWDEIGATSEWLTRTIPSILHSVPVNSSSDPLDLFGKVNVPSGLHDDDIDVDGFLQTRAFALTGGWAAIALRFAGTCDKDAIAIIKSGCQSLERVLREDNEETIQMKWVYMTCMSSAAVSLSIVAAGSGDVDVFRILRRLRKVGAPSLGKSRYGFHLANHLAIGFLFLGGGCQTFGSSNEAIFGLLCAIYPHFPHDVNDNKYHLQAFRHLYVLSAEPRCVETRDVDTGNSCSVNVKFLMSDGSIVRDRAPCIVPRASSVKHILVASERYMPRQVSVNPAASGRGWFSQTNNQVMYVKRRVGHLPYESDPKGSRSIQSRTFPRRKTKTGLQRGFKDAQGDLASSYRADPDILSFDEVFCNDISTESTTSVDRLRTSRRNQEALHQCLSEDKSGAIFYFVDVWRMNACCDGSLRDAMCLDSLEIINAYVAFDASSRRSLVRPSLLAATLQRTEFSRAEGDHEGLVPRSMH